jgi:uroporphyrinogen-III synthase
VKPLLILRPEPGAGATAARATALGLAPVVCPLFQIAPRKWDAPDPADHDALVLTSANAVRYAGYQLTKYAHLPVFTVGSATAKVARAAGLPDIHTGSHNAASLFKTLEKRGLKHPLHLAGEDRTPYPDLFFDITTRTVYASDPVETDLSDEPRVALLHSARAAQRFAELCPSPVTTDIVAISAEVAAAAGTGWASISISGAPNDDDMLALAVRLCKSLPDGQPIS